MIAEERALQELLRSMSDEDRARMPPDHTKLQCLNTILAKGYLQLTDATGWDGMAMKQAATVDSTTITKQLSGEPNAATISMTQRSQSFKTNITTILRQCQRGGGPPHAQPADSAKRSRRQQAVGVRMHRHV